MVFIKNNIILEDKYLTIPKNRNYIPISDIYDVLRIYNGRIFDFEQHFDRLDSMLTKSNNKINLDKFKLIENIEKLIYLNKTKNAMVYIHIQNENIIIYIEDIERPLNNFNNGVKLFLTKDIRTNGNIKSLNRIGTIINQTIAEKNDCFEALMVLNNYITECSHSNIFIVKNKTIYSPKLNNFILNGTTRGLVINIINKLNLNFKEKNITLSELIDSDEIFITNIVEEITPVIEIKNSNFKNKKVGEMTRILQKEYFNLIDEEFWNWKNLNFCFIHY